MSKKKYIPSGFFVGQRVRLSQYAIDCGIRLQKRAGNMGTVVGNSGTTRLGVRVRPDNYKNASGYAAAFWEPIR